MYHTNQSFSIGACIFELIQFLFWSNIQSLRLQITLRDFQIPFATMRTQMKFAKFFHNIASNIFILHPVIACLETFFSSYFAMYILRLESAEDEKRFKPLIFFCIHKIKLNINFRSCVNPFEFNYVSGCQTKYSVRQQCKTLIA